MRALLTVVILWCWNPVTTDIKCNPEPGVTYLQEAAYIRVVGEQPCSDDPGAGGCPVYMLEDFQVLRWDADPCWPVMPEPGLGEVQLMRVTAYDLAGNPDTGIDQCGV